ncbi:heavy metal translocating P-type ATPase [Mesomycoplasma bovoculi]|uniref:Heavy-metal transporting P-type ATPase n=1 Tax=Mesomycoplasma bovoculi M165/69 TaxID=743966 RepID=W5UTT2_9BACT|nr:cation-translocating P-type ATPase [Mesomycoplasma bovoculi]AHH45230.1 Heavy-metal transporting P-type ATPase [Mesomycoplasma bovoculi M165/69]
MNKTDAYQKFKIITESIIFLFVFIVFILEQTLFSNTHGSGNNHESGNNNVNSTFLVLISLLFAFAILVIFLERKYFFSYKNLLKGIFTMDLLIAIAGHFSFLYSAIAFIIKASQGKEVHMEFFEISIVLFLFFNVGRYIETKLQKNSNSGLKELLKLKNKNSFIMVNGTKTEIPTFKIKPGDLVFVAKGESVPVDGTLQSNLAVLDYSSINGEPLPISFDQGQEILSGSINTGEAIIILATKNSANSFLMQTINRLETIFEQPSKIEKISSKIVSVFTPSVLLLSLTMFVVWLIIGYTLGTDKIYSIFKGPKDNPFAAATYVATAVLVISCPCAFGIAAPIAIYSSSILASKNKILFGNAGVYEQVLQTKTIVFDKTGTLTKGQPAVENFQGDLSNLSLIKQLAMVSQHPISKAISNYIEINVEHLDNVVETPGQGLFVELNNSQYSLTSLDYAQKAGFVFEEFDFDKVGNYTVFAKDSKIVGVFLIQDQIKEDTKKVITKLRDLGYEPIIASGDNEQNVSKVAAQVGIDKYFANLKPFDKEKLIIDLKDNGVIFVGDGINDILASKQATLSMSFDNGSKLNSSIADVTLLETNLSLVYKTISIIKKTNQLIKINFSWAIVFNLIFIPLAAAGIIFPVIGMVLMFVSSTFLILNTLFFKKRNEKFLQKSL